MAPTSTKRNDVTLGMWKTLKLIEIVKINYRSLTNGQQKIWKEGTVGCRMLACIGCTSVVQCEQTAVLRSVEMQNFSAAEYGKAIRGNLWNGSRQSINYINNIRSWKFRHCFLAVRWRLWIWYEFRFVHSIILAVDRRSRVITSIFTSGRSHQYLWSNNCISHSSLCSYIARWTMFIIAPYWINCMCLSVQKEPNMHTKLLPVIASLQIASMRHMADISQ